MKPLLEHIQFPKDSSFDIIHTPNLNDTFYWHYHPEIELVYAKSPQGVRHIGSHISYYNNSDLVLIGSHIPHLNFDYGVEALVETTVIHMPSHFLEAYSKSSPEFAIFKSLLQKANKGVAFSGATKAKVGEHLEELPELDHYQRLLKLLNLLGILAKSEEYQCLNAQPIKTDKTLKAQERIQKVFHWVEDHYTKTIKVEEIAHLVNLSSTAFSRWFKQETGDTFINYVNDQRLYHAKNLLLKGKNVSESCYSCGFNSLSYFNRVFKYKVGCSPKDYAKSSL